MQSISIPKENMAWKIRAHFAGKLPPKEYVTPDIRSNNPGWGDVIFARSLEGLEFFLPTGHRIVLAGMEQYNFFVEATQDMGGGRAKIEAFYFCGKIPNTKIVEVWRVAQGEVVRTRREFGKEWGGGPTSGWKSGTIGAKVISAFVKGH